MSIYVITIYISDLPILMDRKSFFNLNFIFETFWHFPFQASKWHIIISAYKVCSLLDFAIFTLKNNSLLWLIMKQFWILLKGLE